MYLDIKDLSTPAYLYSWSFSKLRARMYTISTRFGGFSGELNIFRHNRLDVKARKVGGPGRKKRTTLHFAVFAKMRHRTWSVPTWQPPFSSNPKYLSRFEINKPRSLLSSGDQFGLLGAYTNLGG